MEVLLIGGSGSLMNAMLNKLNKEGHRSYVLTGSRNAAGVYKNVYERYNFSYDCDCLNEIFESINPDVILFTGAYDPNFSWEDPRRESVRFLAGIQNVVSAFAMMKKGRLIFLSSQEVYTNSYPNDISEQVQASAASLRGITYVQGEELCRNYHQTMGLDTVVLRLDYLYAVPHGERLLGERLRDNVCARMCVEALRTGSIQASANKVFSMLHLDDAVEFIYQVVRAQRTQRQLYHLSSQQPLTELALAQLVQKEMGDRVGLTDQTVGSEYRVILSAKAFADEFGMKLFHAYEPSVAVMAKYFRRHAGDYLRETDTGAGAVTRLRQTLLYLVRALVPFLENIVCLVPVFLLDEGAADSAYFARLDFYLLYVLFFAMMHGQQQAVFSAVLSAGGYCLRQAHRIGGLEVFLDHNTYVWVAQLFILGLSAGYLKDRLAAVQGEDLEEMQYLAGQLDDIHDINTSNVRLKNVLEVQIVNQNDSFGKIYEITSSLDQYDPSEVLFYAAEILSGLVGSKDVAIYSVANDSYARLFSATSKKARELGNSIAYKSYGQMYEDLKERRVYINKTMDENYPLMANAIYSEDRMQLILMIWGIPWERMTLAQANMLVVIGYLIQNAVVRASRYIEALEHQRYVGGTRIMETEAFASLVKAYLKARNKDLTECTILRIDIPKHRQEEAAAALEKLMRQSDYLGRLSDGNLYALLANTEHKDAMLVIQRFSEAGYPSRVREGMEL